MEGLDKIRESVLKRAALAADKILDEAKADAEAIMARAEEEANRLNDELDQELSRRRAGAITRASAMGELEQRRVLLEARQKLITETFEKAMAKLAASNSEVRKKFYLRLLENVAANGQTITFSKADESLAADVVKASGFDLNITEADDSFSGGFILREGRVRWRYTFEDILEADRDSYLELVASILYPPAEQRSSVLNGAAVTERNNGDD